MIGSNFIGMFTRGVEQRANWLSSLNLSNMILCYNLILSVSDYEYYFLVCIRCMHTGFSCHKANGKSLMGSWEDAKKFL